MMRVRVGYLGGLGRSGTTLLARLLGELPDVCSVGELCHLWDRGVAANERCGCGKAFRDCPFWTRVGDEAFGGWQRLDLARVRALRADVDRTRHIPWLATRTPRRTHHVLTEYLRLYERLYAAIREVSGRPVVLDASKNGALAFCLRWSPRLELRVLHCLRDSPAVTYSWQRMVARPEVVDGEDYMPVYSPLRSAGLWNVENAAFELLARRGTPTLRLRYEDLTADPASVTRRAAGFLDVAVPGRGPVTDGVARLRPGHSVSGNPMRFAGGDVAVRPDDAWRSALRPSARRLVSVLTFPLRARYGYPEKRR